MYIETCSATSNFMIVSSSLQELRRIRDGQFPRSHELRPLLRPKVPIHHPARCSCPPSPSLLSRIVLNSDPDRSSVLYTLALFLLAKCERWEDADGLEEAMQLNREALLSGLNRTLQVEIDRKREMPVCGYYLSLRRFPLNATEFRDAMYLHASYH